VTIKITPNDKGHPPGKLADAEVHFSDGAFGGLRLIGFSIWERRGGSGRNVTFPARQYSVNGERRSFALLRPIADATAQNKLRELILEAFQEYEERAAIASCTGSSSKRGCVDSLLDNRQELRVFRGALGRKRPLFTQALVVLRVEERRLHAAVDDVPRQHGVMGAVAENIEVAVDP
jgi:hypothetical protein